MIMKRSLPVHLILLLIILVFAALIRMPTFKLPHDNGDQVFYLALAMNLDKFGFSEYTMRGIDLVGNDFVLGLIPARGQKGSLLEGLISSGVTYYDEPMFHRPYGFAYALMLSHRLFAGGKDYVALRSGGRDAAGRVYSKNADKTWYSQFYAAFVPFLFSILLILATYLLAAKMFSREAALISAFLMAISPIEILSSQKIWADTMLSFFVILTVLLFFAGRDKNSMIFSFLAGVSSGTAVLVKQTGGFIIIAILIFHLWQNRYRLFKLGEIPRVLFEKHLLIFGLGMLAVTFHWFYAASATYGHPLYAPHIDKEVFKEVGWFMTLRARPRFLYLAAIPYLVPLFALGYFSVIRAVCTEKSVSDRKVFLIIWVLTFLGILILRSTKENRYMLPAYPALAILSADILRGIGAFIDARIKGHYGGIFIVAALIACALWSAPIGIRHALANAALILKPF